MAEVVQSQGQSFLNCGTMTESRHDCTHWTQCLKQHLQVGRTATFDILVHRWFTWAGLALVVTESLGGRDHRDRHKAVRVTVDVDSLSPSKTVCVWPWWNQNWDRFYKFTMIHCIKMTNSNDSCVSCVMGGRKEGKRKGGWRGGWLTVQHGFQSILLGICLGL